MRRWALLNKTIIVACALYACAAQAFGPDTSFGNQGRVVVSAGQASQAILQTDGKLVIVGTTVPYDASSCAPPSYLPPDADFLIARFNTDGTADKTFGGTGLITVDFFGGSDHAAAVTQQPDGKLLVAGSAINATGMTAGAAARLNTDGSLDTSFNSTGKLTFDTLPQKYLNTVSTGFTPLIVTPGAFTFTSVFALPDGRMVFAAPSCPLSFAITIRVKSNGQLDATFGPEGTGWIISTLSTWTRRSSGAYLAAAGANGKQLQQFDADGNPDPTFGANGFLEFPEPTLDESNPQALAIRPHGEILIVGTKFAVTPPLVSDGFVTQITPQGAMDTSFGTGGNASGYQGDFDNETASVVLEPGGKVLLAGMSQRTSDFFSLEDASVVRLGSNGTLDSTFGTAGRSVLDFSEGSTTYSSATVALLRRHDGRLIVVANRGHLSMGKPYPPGLLNAAGQQIIVEQLTSTPQFDWQTAAVTAASTDSSATLTVTRNGNPDGPVSVDYSIANGGSAVTSAVSGSLTWQPGDAADKTITISLDATHRQADQQLNVLLDNPTEGTVGTSTATVTVKAIPATTPSADTKGGGGGTVGSLMLGFLTALQVWKRRPRRGQVIAS